MAKITTRQMIRNLFVSNGNHYLITGEIVALTDAATQTVYSTISSMATANPPELERRSSNGVYQYRLYSSVYNNLAFQALQQKQNPAPNTPDEKSLAEKVKEAVAETQPEATVQVKIIPEGVSAKAAAKARAAYWRDEDREAFALNFARLQAEQPLRDFELLAMEAQKDFPREKVKIIKARREISSWFEASLASARNIAKKEKQDQEKREQEERAAQEAQRQQETLLQQQGQVLQTLSNLDLFGEVMKRGQSLIETMLCNALQSPNVQRTLIETLNLNSSERRMYARSAHSPDMPADESRKRLKRIGILGVNKPIHQTQMKQRMEGMYDLRFGNVDANAARLQESMTNCDEVFLLTDHVPHRTNAQLKAASIKFTPMSGDKRAIEEFLSKRYLEENE